MNEWKKVKLGDCIKEVNERTKKNNQYEVLTSSKNGIYSQEEYFDKQVASKDNTGYKIIKRGQFTYRSMSDNGTFTINRLENKDIGIVSPAYPVFEATNINAEYLKYFFQSEEFRKAIYNLSQGSTRTALKYKDLSNIDILLPPIEEQEKIVKILRDTDYIIEKYGLLLEEKKQFIKSQFVEMFEKINNSAIRVEKLKNISKFQQGTQVDVEKQIAEKKEGYVRFLRIIDYTQASQPERYVKNEGKYITKDSVVVVRYGASAGFVGKGYEGILANNLFEVIPDELLMSKEFLYNNLKYGNFENEINQRSSGAAMPALSFNIVGDINIAVPPKKLQEEYNKIVQLIDKQRFLLEQQKQNYENLKKGLMQKLLTGKVRVKI